MSAAPMLADLLAGYEVLAPELHVTGLALDSRRVGPGDLFLALPGVRGHGLEHAEAAVRAGATAVLYDPEGAGELPVTGAPMLAVPELKRRAGEIASRHFGQPSTRMRVLAVTGTNGKSSVVHLLGQALDRLGYRVATLGTLGMGPVGRLEASERTTPDCVSLHRWLAEMHAAGITHVAMEASSHALDQHRLAGLSIDTAIFTNLSRDHLDYHGDMEAYFAAKARLFRWPGLRAAVIHRDDPFGRRLRPRAQSLVSFGFGAEAVVRGEDLRLTPQGMTLRIATPWGAGTFESPLLGGFNAANLLAVTAALCAIGVEWRELRRLLPALTPVHGRMSRYGGGAQPLVVVDYAHSPDALAQALGSLRAHLEGRLWCVFGCGGERDRGKRPEMGEIAERLADRLLLTDDNPRGEDPAAIVAEIRAGLLRPERVEVEHDRAAAIRRAVLGARPGDIVLVAGKGHERTQEIGGVHLPFDDHEVVRAALAARGGSAMAEEVAA